MAKFGAELLVPKLVIQALQKSGLASQMSQKLRVSLQSEGEGEDALKLRDLASRSLMGQH
ncbi:MAG: hypothetical protein BM558_10960 [Roseobacter sp. MedPE-SW]|nr:MAG: hypothetical protein BM558_10960 [Roseobacter sp. MedPE-SW]